MFNTYRSQPRNSSHPRREALERADDRYRQLMAEWAAGGYDGDPPEFHGDDSTARISTTGGVEIVFPLMLPEQTLQGDSEPADASNADRIWRIAAGLASGPPPPVDTDDGETA